MRNKRLIIAVASGLICAVSVFAFTQSVQAEADASRAEALAKFGGEQIEVCVATRDIAAGEVPSASCVATKMWISDLLPCDPITSLNEVSSQQLTSPVVEGEVLSKRHFEASGASFEVPAGYCALSVPAEEVKAVGGAVSAGMKVDVYLSGSSGITLLAYDVQVLATSTGESESSGSTKISWMTLAVEPKSVHEFISAADEGSLYFVLQGEKTDEETESDGAASDDSVSDDEAESTGAASSSSSSSSKSSSSTASSSSSSTTSSSSTSKSSSSTASSSSATASSSSSSKKKATQEDE